MLRPELSDREDTVRFVISIIAALMILSLAAFAVVSAQKMSTAPAQRMNSDSPVAPAWQAAPTVSQIVSPEAPAATVTSGPIRMRQAQATTPRAPAAY